MKTLNRRKKSTQRNLIHEILDQRQLLTAVPIMIADVHDSGVGSYPTAFFQWNDKLVFAHSGEDNVEPWFYDGSGTRRSTTFERDDDDALIATEFVEYNGDLFFSAIENDDDDGQIWRFDGTQFSAADRFCFDRDGDTECETRHYDPSDLVLFDNAIFFSGNYAAPDDPEDPDGRWHDVGRKLLRLDEDGVELTVDIRDSEIADRYGNLQGSDPWDLTVYDGDLYFSAFTDELGRELWKYDGQAASLVADIIVGPNGAEPTDLLVHDGILYFSAFESEHGRELWSFDGQSARWHEIVPGKDSGQPGDFASYDGELYFAADNAGHGRELWKLTNGQSAVEIADIQSGGSSNPEDLVVFGGRLYFSAAEFGAERELWSFDGQSTQLAVDIRPGPKGSFPKEMTVYRDELVFAADGGKHGSELWTFDGTHGSQVADLLPVPNSAYPQFLTEHQDSVYFGASSRDGAGLWRYDGNLTERVNLTGGGSGVFGAPGFMASTSEGLFLRAYQEGVGNEPAFYDGVSVSLVEDIWPGSNGSVASSDNESVSFQGKVYFGAQNDQDQGELWVYDGRQAFPFAGLPSGQSTWAPQGFVATDDALYFMKYVTQSSANVYRFDGQRAELIDTIQRVSHLAVFDQDLYIASFTAGSHKRTLLHRFDGNQTTLLRQFAGGSPRDMAVIGDRLVLSVAGRLWSTDGIEFLDITPSNGFDSHWLAAMTPHHDELYFVAIRSPQGPFAGTLWKTDGWTAERVFPHSPDGGPLVSSRHGTLLSFQDELVFAADDNVNGVELWKMIESDPGDATLDGVFNSSDLVAVFQAGKYETGRPAAWQEGDWDLDGDFDSSDIVLAFSAGHYDGARSAPSLSQNCCYIESWLEVSPFHKFQQLKARDEQWTQRHEETSSFDLNGNWQT